jgi:ATP-dependent helicase/DNAse subunit B
VIYDAALRELLRARHSRVTPSGIEDFLQCPFRFFSGHTLALENPPPAPFERLDARVKGSILHAALARSAAGAAALREVFQSAFLAACGKNAIPPGYRTEALRREMLRDLERFASELAFPGQWSSRTEWKFKLALDGGLLLEGRVDRLDVSEGRALLVDYKYSRADRIGALVQSHEDGTKVQGGLYMAAVERLLGCEVIAMLFAGFRREVSWRGWRLALPGFDGCGPASRAEDLRLLRDQSLHTTTDAVARLRDGTIEAKPADVELCQSCDFRDICRVESAAHAAKAGGLRWN